MNTFISEVSRLLNDTLTVTAYLDVVPETAPLPAVSFYNVGFQPARIVGRKRVPAKSSFRVNLVVDSMSQVDATLAELNSLDNTSNADFQDIQVVMNRVEAKDPDSTVRRIFIDLDVTEKL